MINNHYKRLIITVYIYNGKPYNSDNHYFISLYIITIITINSWLIISKSHHLFNKWPDTSFFLEPSIWIAPAGCSPPGSQKVRSVPWGHFQLSEQMDFHIHINVIRMISYWYRMMMVVNVVLPPNNWKTCCWFKALTLRIGEGESLNTAPTINNGSNGSR